MTGLRFNGGAPRRFVRLACLAAAVIVASAALSAATPLPGWKYSGTLMLLTTPEGAYLPPGAMVEEFPVLVRLDGDWFDFPQARPDGADVRFTTAEGKLLPHQIEEWDAKRGTASIWVRVPRIEGNARLRLQMHWGKADAASASDGKAVFNESNGYLSVWHMADSVRDDVGTLESKDTGTTMTAGVIGAARHFPGKAGISCGNKISNYPTGNSPHTTELWFRAARSSVSLIAWGTETRQGKAVMQLRGPPHIRMDCWFSDGNVESAGLLALNEWNHAAFVYETGNAQIYLNGALAGNSKGRATPLNIKSPAELSIGGWRGDFSFLGDLDEARVSKVARSAAWLRLQYENQKPMQTLVGPLVRPGADLAVSPEQAVVAEGGRARFTAHAGGAQKLYWSLLRDGRGEIVAVDRFAFDFAAGRVAGDSFATLRLQAVFPDGVMTRDIPITVKEAIPDPEFTLPAPAAWDGRSTIEIVPRVTNLEALRNAGASELQMAWRVGPLAVIKETGPGKLRLLGAQKSGPLTVTATISNGGNAVTRSAAIAVTEPLRDAWVQRTPERDEKPEEGQFYARDDRNEGTLYYNGTLKEPADEVFLKVFADDKPFATATAKPGADLSYAFAVKLRPGFVKYRVEFGTRDGAKETVLDKVGNLICGDAFLIEGQSNAEALDLREESQKPRETNEWIRTFGGPRGGEDAVSWVRDYTSKAKVEGKQPSLWRLAVWKQKPPEHDSHIGWWGMELAKRLVASQHVPVFILNGALGGTRIDEHQRNAANPADLTTIYGKWLWRLQQARLTHGIRAVIWHQGENDQPADTPTGDYGWKNYQQYFIDMAAGWKRDLPNARHYYLFQIWPNSCGMGGQDGAGDRLREQQRTLPGHFSNLSIMSTLGIRPPGGCHYPLEGYNEFARLLQPLIERDLYGKKPQGSFTPPNLLRVSYASPARDALWLDFDQPVVWRDQLASQFYMDGEQDKIASGSVAGSVLTLKLTKPSTAKHITYLKEAKWSQDNLLLGENGIAALTFCEVPVADPAPVK